MREGQDIGNLPATDSGCEYLDQNIVFRLRLGYRSIFVEELILLVEDECWLVIPNASAYAHAQLLLSLGNRWMKDIHALLPWPSSAGSCSSQRLHMMPAHMVLPVCEQCYDPLSSLSGLAERAGISICEGRFVEIEGRP